MLNALQRFQQLKLLTPELRQKHEKMMKDYIEFIIKNINPKHIVFLGLTVYNKFTNCFNVPKANEIQYSKPSKSGKSNPTYYKKVIYNKVPLHGLIHLSGAQPSEGALGHIREIFTEII